MDVTERFLQYVAFDTASDEDSPSTPSTPKQKVLGRFLEEELRKIGLSSVVLDENGYLYGVLPASPGCERLPALGLISHMDTSPSVSGANIRPSRIRYQGGDITLPHAVISQEEYPDVAKYAGQELIVTDGSTLLGADDKAGIAEIFTACEYLVAHPEIPHRAVAVGITPDEEIGRGADHFDLSRFPAPTAYTVDGGELGEIEYENFNAASAVITVHGVNIHPGSAKNKMKNASLLAADFITRLPPAETPAHTEGYEGFYHLTGMEGDETTAVLRWIIRDHDRERFEARKKFMADLCAYLNGVWGEGTFVAEIKDSYYNMKEKILPHMELIENAKAAMRAVGAEPRIVAIRGGTDGARLSYEGLPCPNLSTGGLNFHSVRELIPVPAMEKMVQVLVELLKAQPKSAPERPAPNKTQSKILFQ